MLKLAKESMTLEEIRESCERMAKVLEDTGVWYQIAWKAFVADKESEDRRRELDMARGAIDTAAVLCRLWHKMYYEVKQEQDPGKRFFPGLSLVFGQDRRTA